MSDTDEIRTLIEMRVEALQRRDAEAANACLASHIVAFEVAGPLQLPSAQAIDNAQTQAWLDSFEEGPTISLDELAIYADGAVGFCHCLNRVRGQRARGHEVDVTMRSTLGLRKLRGEWKVVHGHTSLPR